MMEQLESNVIKDTFVYLEQLLRVLVLQENIMISKVHQVQISASTAQQIKSATLRGLETLLPNAMKGIIVRQKMVSSQKLSVILDTDALPTSKPSSDAYQELIKVYQVKNPVQSVQLAIIAMKAMGCQFQLHKNAPKDTTALIFLLNLLRIPILLLFTHLSHAQLDFIVMSLSSQVSLNVKLVQLGIDAIERVRRLMTMVH